MCYKLVIFFQTQKYMKYYQKEKFLSKYSQNTQ